jgi:lipopolysaccharide transport system ATP-binding protein
MSDRDVVIRVEGISKLYRLGEVGTGSLAHDVNRWWHRVRGKEDPYLKIGEVNDRTKPAKQASSKKSLTTEDTESTEVGAGGNQRSDSAEFSEGHSQAGLQMNSEKLASIRSANDSRASGEQTGSDSESVIIRDIRGKKSSSEALDSRPSSLDSPKAPPSDWVYALKDVSFEVKRGEVLGIIGRNGAGKSTLLKILSRVTTQSSGQIKVKGRIASLLEVGTGFHPELTGRENIFLNGAILGMRKAEIARKFDEIVEFSGCARYIDTPVKRYSSGMYVRLAFAVAAHLEPEILIVDEVLAVGDAEFQKKCLGKMKDVAGHGRTILFVSHNMTAVQNLCTRGIIIKNGNVDFDGGIYEALQKYSLSFFENNNKKPQANISENIISAVISNENNEQQKNIISTDKPIIIKVKLNLNDKTKCINQVGIGIDNALGQRITTIGTYLSDSVSWNTTLNGIINCYIPSLPVASGKYSLKIALGNEHGDFESIENALPFEVISCDFYGNGKFPTSTQGQLLTISKWSIN